MKNWINQYQQGYAQILREIDGLTTEQIDFKPSSDSWSIREILIHVTDAEMVHIHRMKAVLAEDNPLLTAFDQDQWATRLNYQIIDFKLYLSLFGSLRDSFSPILANLTERDFSRIGTHNQAGQLSFSEILIHSVEHVDGHIEQIRKVKSLFS